MSEDRKISLSDLNRMIEEEIKQYESSAEECFAAKALSDLQIKLNDPESVVDTSENVQQTINVEHTKRIINDNDMPDMLP